MRQQWLVFLPMALATGGLAACASMLGGEQVKIRPVDTLSAFRISRHLALVSGYEFGNPKWAKQCCS